MLQTIIAMCHAALDNNTISLYSLSADKAFNEMEALYLINKVANICFYAITQEQFSLVKLIRDVAASADFDLNEFNETMRGIAMLFATDSIDPDDFSTLNEIAARLTKYID